MDKRLQTKGRVVLSWSGGKDSALALHELQKCGRYEVVALLTSIAQEYRRISHHGVREDLLERQAKAIGLPLYKLYLPSNSQQPCTNEVYEGVVEQALLELKSQGVFMVAHGDIFLQDLREYRERNLAKVGMRGLFPIWRRDTTELVQTFITLGFKAYLSCVEGKLGESFAGRAIDVDLIRDLPEGIDPCGEYGEYHSFVYDGPIFRHRVEVKVGQTVMRDGRFYADLLPGDASEATRPEVLKIPPIR
ncbi:MAG: diphthine--ammonia ligase [Pirellulales bacterium]